jgi:rhamnose transport system permease protein
MPPEPTTRPGAGPAERPLHTRLLRWETALAALLVAVVVIGSQLNEDFLTSINFRFLALDVAEIALLVLPLTLVIVAGEIDLSIASMLGLSSALLGWLWDAGLPMALVLPLVVVAGAAAGAFNGLLVTRLGLPSLAVTIGTLALYRGLAFVLLGDRAVVDFPELWTGLGFGTVPGTRIPWATLLFVVLAVGFGVLLHTTVFGRRVFAIGANAQTAFFSGVRVKRIKLILFTLSGVVAALAGIVYTFRFASARADNGAGLELAVVGAVLLGGVSIFGGKGTLLGVIAAVFLFGAIRSLLILDDVSNEILTIVNGTLLLVSVLAPNLVARVGAVRSRRAAVAGDAG